jgi:predicted site-specific integrase-resolvase
MIMKMKLSQYAKQQGISYRTALRWFRAGAIAGYQAPSGTIIVQEEKPTSASTSRVVIYAHVSSAEQRAKRKTAKIAQELEAEDAVS